MRKDENVKTPKACEHICDFNHIVYKSEEWLLKENFPRTRIELRAGYMKPFPLGQSLHCFLDHAC